MGLNKLKLLAAVALCLAYAAGIATGWAGYTLAGEQPPPPGERGSWISETLGLSADQKAKMEQIWSDEALGHGGDERAQMRALYDERDSQIRALLTEAQAASFDEIHQKCDEKRQAIYDERRRGREEAIKQTMAILSPEQQEKYKRILEDFEKRGPRRERGSSDWHPERSESGQRGGSVPAKP